MMKNLIWLLILLFILTGQTIAQEKKINLTKSEKARILNTITEDFRKDLKKEKKINLLAVETPKEIVELFKLKFGRGKVEIISNQKAIDLVKANSWYYGLGPLKYYKSSFSAFFDVNSYDRILYKFYRKNGKLIKKKSTVAIGPCGPGLSGPDEPPPPEFKKPNE